MRTRFAYVALAALLLVGAGCAAQQKGSVDIESGMEGDAGIDANLDAGASVDAAINAMFADIDDEQATEAELDADARMKEDAELNAYSEGSYELK